MIANIADEVERWFERRDAGSGARKQKSSLSQLRPCHRVFAQSLVR